MKRAREARDSSHVLELLDKQGPCLRLAPVSVSGRAMPETSVAFRDLETGLLRVVQRELVVRFHSRASRTSVSPWRMPAWAEGKGTAIFCAAGNDGGGPVSFPAREAGVIAVGAVTDQERRAGFSNVGPELSLVAPSSGGLRGIFTTAVGGTHTDRFGGTSASTALAAGTAALVLSGNPDLTREELKELLESTADKIAGPYDARGHSEETGFGRVNAGNAVLRAAK